MNKIPDLDKLLIYPINKKNDKMVYETRLVELNAVWKIL